MDFTNKLVLAPMAGVCDQPFRLLAKEQGCDILYTEMISAKGLYYDNKNTVPLLAVSPEEDPIWVRPGAACRDGEEDRRSWICICRCEYGLPGSEDCE